MNYSVSECVNKKIWPVALLLLSFLLYFPFLGKGFISDDFIHIHHIINVDGILMNPGPFGFFRPIYEFSFYLNYLLSGFLPSWFELTNLLFHLLVVFLLYKFVFLLFDDRRIAFFSGLAFSLAPKSNAMAVLWISGRSDLLMSIFVLSSMIYWLKWMKSGRKLFLSATFLFYVLSILCKESALLLPVLLYFTSPAPEPAKKRRSRALLLFAGALPVLLLRIQVGALMPDSIDAHYNLMVPILVVAGNLFNYFFRAIPHVVLLLLFTLLPLYIKFGGWKTKFKAVFTSGDTLKTVFFSFLWFLVFLVPASPIKMRSELYLYLPTAGFCILGAVLLIKTLDTLNTDTLSGKKKLTPLLLTGSLVFVLLSGSYITIRNVTFSSASDFSYEFVNSLPGAVPPEMIDSPGCFLFLEPLDKETEKMLRASVHGYFDTVVKLIFNRNDIGGWIAYKSDILVPSGIKGSRKKINLSVSYAKPRFSYKLLNKSSPSSLNRGGLFDQKVKQEAAEKRRPGGRLQKRKERLKQQKKTKQEAPKNGNIGPTEPTYDGMNPWE